MTRALPLTERQARTLLRAADKERGIVEVKIGDTFVRLIPESRSQQDRPVADGCPERRPLMRQENSTSAPNLKQ